LSHFVAPHKTTEARLTHTGKAVMHKYDTLLVTQKQNLAFAIIVSRFYVLCSTLKRSQRWKSHSLPSIKMRWGKNEEDAWRMVGGESSSAAEKLVESFFYQNSPTSEFESKN
jgi:hypothetical protein